MRTILTLLIFIFLHLIGTNGFGQSKKRLTVEDYDRWNHFYQYTLSPDAKWVSYIIHDQKDKDTMVLRTTDSLFKHMIAGAKQGSFSPESGRFAFIKDSVLIHQDLENGKLDSISSVDSYLFSREGNYLIAERYKKKELALIYLPTNTIQVITSVLAHVLSPDSSKIAIIQRKEDQNVISIITLKKSLEVFDIARSTENLLDLTWNTKGEGLAFFESVFTQVEGQAHHKVHYITFKEKHLPTVLTHKTSTQLPVDFEVPISRLFFSSNDEVLFFDVKSKIQNDNQPKQVIIWSAIAKVLPPPEKKTARNILMSWQLKSDRFIQVSDEKQPISIPTSTGKHALVVDGANYSPHFQYNGIYVDLYIKDLQTGEKKLIVQKINHQENHINVSPHGKYITWFSNANWWLYDINTDKTRCLTCSTKTQFENLEYDYPGAKFPNDKPHWTKDDKFVLLTDFYDVWQFNPNGETRKRLTDGNAAKIKFRLYDERFTKTIRDYFFLYQTRSYALDNGLIFKGINTKTLAEGFSFYQISKPLQQVFYADDRISSIDKVKNTYLYVLSDFDKSPELVIQRSDQIAGEVIQRSNEHQKEYYWGKSELIHYEVNGVPLKGALLYPANYQPGKIYPMIVKIYERMSSFLRKYVEPSTQNPIGFNETNYTSADYFILLPDIDFTINAPGESALRCVLAAVDKAIGTASIDADHIGLFGHSFAGFEVSYIATQTQRFKTIVSGAGWHDLVGTYLGTDDSNVSNIWRFDTQQLRITEPYYSKGFMSNSPILRADKIQTPILLWTGMEDLRVNWQNSLKMQTALWRTGKESILLLYPNEGHVILEPKKQYDLSLKTMQWFDYYLKGEPKSEWMDIQ